MYRLLPTLLFAFVLFVIIDDVYDNSWAVIIGINNYQNIDISYRIEWISDGPFNQGFNMGWLKNE